MSEPQGTLKGTPLCRVWPQIEYTRADFRRLADNLLGIPFGSTGPLANPSMDRPLPEIFLGDMDRWTIAMHLRRYADQLKPSAKVGAKRKDRKHYAIATDYEATRERLGTREDALQQVMDAWNVERTVVTDSCRINRRYAQQEISRMEIANPELTRHDLLAAISRELRSPEN